MCVEAFFTTIFLNLINHFHLCDFAQSKCLCYMLLHKLKDLERPCNFVSFARNETNVSAAFGATRIVAPFFHQPIKCLTFGVQARFGRFWPEKKPKKFQKESVARNKAIWCVSLKCTCENVSACPWGPS